MVKGVTHKGWWICLSPRANFWTHQKIWNFVVKGVTHKGWCEFVKVPGLGQLAMVAKSGMKIFKVPVSRKTKQKCNPGISMVTRNFVVKGVTHKEWWICQSPRIGPTSKGGKVREWKFSKYQYEEYQKENPQSKKKAKMQPGLKYGYQEFSHPSHPAKVASSSKSQTQTLTTCLADKTNHPVERLSLNRSQCGSCSTKYDTSAGT